MTQTLLALDLGTTTGFAVGAPNGGALVTGTWGLKPGRYDGGGMRFVKFRQKLNEMQTAFGVDMVCFEEVRNHRGIDAAHVYGGLMAVLQEWCELNQIPYEGIPVGTIKKFAAGNGNATKDMVMAAVRSWGYEPADYDEADATALWHCKAAETKSGVSRGEAA